MDMVTLGGRVSAALMTLALGCCLLLSPAAAQDVALNTERFHAVSGAGGGALLEGVTVGESWQLDAALWLHVSRRPMMLTLDGVVDKPAITGRLGGSVHGAFTVGSRVRVAVDLPVTLYQEGVDPISRATLPRGGVGDLRLTPKVLLLHPDRSWLGLSMSSPVSFPTGNKAALMGEAGPTVQPRLHLEKRMFWPSVPILRFAVALEFGWRFRQRTQILDLDTSGEFTIGAGIRWEPLDRLRVGTELVASVGTGLNGRNGELATWISMTLDRAEQVDVLGGFTMGVGQGVGTPEARGFVAVRARLHPLRRVDPRPSSSAVFEALPDSVVQAQARRVDPGPPPPVDEDYAAWGLRLVGRSLTIDSSVLFDFDRSTLKPTAGPVLEKVAIWFTAHEGAGVMEVAGHCDSRGSDGYNDRLSLSRARAVWRFLVERGVPADRLIARGYGKRQPRMKKGDASTEEVHQANRRVEFTFLGHRDAHKH